MSGNMSPIPRETEESVIDQANDLFGQVEFTTIRYQDQLYDEINDDASAISENRVNGANDELNTTIVTSYSNRYFDNPNRQVRDLQRAYSPSSPRLRASKLKNFKLTLSITYETQIGETLAVIGNIPELGQWDDFTKCQMKWTEGHKWVAEDIKIRNKSFFCYKYIIVENGKVKRWERGANRVADLDILPDRSFYNQHVKPQGPNRGIKKSGSQASNLSGDSIKICSIEDEWEQFKVRFTIFDPIEENLLNDGEYMRIIGNTPKMGSANPGEMETTPPIRMSRTNKPVMWLIDKYGVFVRPWEIVISFQMGELDLPADITYNYSKSNQAETQVVQERQPSRAMTINKPEDYKGQLGISGSQQWKNAKQVWIINGLVDKADANFLGGLFFNKIGDLNLSVGTYPLRENDIQKMRVAGINAVLNLQTDSDFEQRGISWDKMLQYYKQNNIKCQRYPIRDHNEDELCAQVFYAAQHINNLINQEGLNVYVHCTSGLSRAPTVIIAYLCLFKRVRQWQDPQDVQRFVKAFHLSSNPNMRAVQRVIQQNLDFQSKQIDVRTERNRKSVISNVSKQALPTGNTEQPEDLMGFYFPQMDGDKDKEAIDRSNSPRRNFTKKRSSYKRQTINPFKSQIPRAPKPDERAATPENQLQSQLSKGSEQRQTRVVETQSTVYEEMSSFNNQTIFESEQAPNRKQLKPENLKASLPRPVQENELDQIKARALKSKRSTPVKDIVDQIIEEEDKLKEEEERQRIIAEDKKRMADEEARREALKKQREQERLERERKREEQRKEEEERKRQEEVKRQEDEAQKAREQLEILEQKRKKAQAEEAELRRLKEEKEREEEMQRQQELIELKAARASEEKRLKMLAQQIKSKEEEELAKIKAQKDLLKAEEEAFRRKQEEIEQEKLKANSYADQLRQKLENEEKLRKQAEEEAQKLRALAEELRLSKEREMRAEQERVEQEKQRAAELERLELEKQRQAEIERHRRAVELEKRRKAEELAREEQAIREQQQRLELEAQKAREAKRERDVSPFTIEKRQRIQSETLENKAKRAEVLRQKRMQAYGTRKSPPKMFNFENFDNVETSSQEEKDVVENLQQVKKTAEFPRTTVTEMVSHQEVVFKQEQIIVESESDSQPRLVKQELRSAAPQTITSSDKERLERIRKESQLIEERERARQEREEKERREIEEMRAAKRDNEIKVIAKLILQDMINEETEALVTQEFNDEFEADLERQRQKAKQRALKMKKRRLEEARVLEEKEQEEEQVQEFEHHALQKIAQDKEERLLLLQKQEEEAERERLDKNAKQKAERQRMFEESEKEMERIRQLKMQQAQEELQRLQELRKVEEDKLNQIKNRFQEEERQRIEAEKERERQIQDQLEKQRQVIREEEEERQRMAEQKRKLQQDLRQKKIESPTQRGAVRRNRFDEEHKKQVIQTQKAEMTMSQSMTTYDNNIKINYIVEPDVTPEAMESHCDEIFKEAPFKFRVQRANRLEIDIQKLIKKYNVTIPIINVRTGQYLVGSQKLMLEYKFQSVIVKQQGGFERFDQYVPKNQRQLQRQLVEHMSNSGQNLQWVVDELIAGRRIRRKSRLPTSSAQLSPEGSPSPVNKTQTHFATYTRQTLKSPVKKVGIKIQSDDEGSISSRKSGASNYSSTRFGGAQHMLRINRDLGQRASFGGIIKKINSPNFSTMELQAQNLSSGQTKKHGLTRIEPYGGNKISQLPQGAYTDRSRGGGESPTRFSVKEVAKKRYVSPQRQKLQELIKQTKINLDSASSYSRGSSGSYNTQLNVSSRKFGTGTSGLGGTRLNIRKNTGWLNK